MIYWAVEIQYEGVYSSHGLFTTKEACEAYIEANEFLRDYAYAEEIAVVG